MSENKVGGDILGVYETHLPVRDLSRSIAFYRDQLGLTLAHQIPERNVAFLWVGKKEVGMVGLWGTGSSPLMMTLHFAFRASRDAILRSCENLVSVGIIPLGSKGQPVSEPVVRGWVPSSSVYFKDPDGHSIEIVHVLEEPADHSFGAKSYSEWLQRSRD